ncbi:hypothetical protein GALMADRAFT_760962 [Galerina marginata CBS 339.88]|uniref:Uncharacterized protein n=1 Tax=Galerina marginata (strain CBS 339.88) TaxID=685588 RepID=A0A067SYB3_GALM3|nr:hypothetical protein GALMADRAFT_760962 [Galerina marginata CBS 339.88]
MVVWSFGDADAFTTQHSGRFSVSLVADVFYAYILHLFFLSYLPCAAPVVHTSQVNARYVSLFLLGCFLHRFCTDSRTIKEFNGLDSFDIIETGPGFKQSPPDTFIGCMGNEDMEVFPSRPEA